MHRKTPSFMANNKRITRTPAPPALKLNLNQQPRVHQTNNFDAVRAADNMPDYLKFPFGQPSSNNNNWFTQNHDGIMDGLLPAKLDPNQYFHMLSPASLFQPTEITQGPRAIGEILDSTLKVHPSITTGGAPYISGLQTSRFDDVEYWRSLGAFDSQPFEQKDKGGLKPTGQATHLGRQVVDAIGDGIATAFVGANAEAMVLPPPAVPMGIGAAGGIAALGIPPLGAQGDNQEYTAVGGHVVDNKVIYPVTEPVGSNILSGEKILQTVYDHIYIFAAVKGMIPIERILPVQEDVGNSVLTFPDKPPVYLPQYYAYSGNPANIRGKEFEDWLVKKLKGKPVGMIDGRDFDVIKGDTWIEAKSGAYWGLTAPGSKGLAKFTSDMGRRLDIANKYGKKYELHSDTPIPSHIKQWLDKKGIEYFEHKKFLEETPCPKPRT